MLETFTPEYGKGGGVRSGNGAQGSGPNRGLSQEEWAGLGYLGTGICTLDQGRPGVQSEARMAIECQP